MDQVFVEGFVEVFGCTMEIPRHDERRAKDKGAGFPVTVEPFEMIPHEAGKPRKGELRRREVEVLVGISSLEYEERLTCLGIPKIHLSDAPSG